MNKIWPSLIEIGFPQIKFSSGQSKNDNVQKAAFKFKPDLLNKKEKGAFEFKILDIIPNEKFKEKFDLVLTNTNEQSTKTSILASLYLSKWRENFIDNRIERGSSITLRKFSVKSCFFSLSEEFRDMNIIDGWKSKNEEKILQRETEKKHRPTVSFETGETAETAEEGKNIKDFIKKPQITVKSRDGQFEETLYNPLFPVYSEFEPDQQSIHKSFFVKDWLGPCHGDLNLDNILVHEKINKKQPHISLIDLASCKSDNPVAFDCVKLETEIKNHILASDEILHQLMEIDSEKKIEDSDLIEFVLKFERRLLLRCPLKYLNSSNTVFIKYLKIINEIRVIGLQRYEKYGITLWKDFQMRYLQQLMLYSLRTMTYKEPKLKPKAKKWAFLAAAVAVEGHAHLKARMKEEVKHQNAENKTE